MRYSLDAMGQGFPHRGELAGQPRQGAEINAAFFWAVEVAAPRSEQIEFFGHVTVFDIFSGGMATRHHLHALSTMIFEFGEEGVFLIGGEVVPTWMGDDGNALRIGARLL